MSKQNSPTKKRLRDAVEEDPEQQVPIDKAVKRQKIDASGNDTKKAVNDNDEDSQDFEPKGRDGDSDSFDDDFDDPEERPHGDDDEGFDLEAYKKWREAHPEEEENDELDFDDDEGGEDDFEGEESELNDDSDAENADAKK